MMAETVKLVSYSDQCNNDLENLLEDILKRVKKGEFTSGAIIMQRGDGSIMNNWSKTDNVHYLVAGSSYLMRDLIEHNRK